MKSLLLPLSLLLCVASDAATPVRHRVAVGALYAESNSFYPAVVQMNRNPAPASREAWLQENARGATLGGIVVTAAGVGLDLYPTVFAGASFLGTVSKASFDRHLNDMIQELKSASPPFQGLFLVNHGALVVEDYRHGDAEAAHRIRQAMGPDFPVIVTQDFHANLAPKLVENTHAVITYKEYPHIDRRERGVQAAQLMARILNREVKPVQAMAKPAMIFNLIHQNTFTGATMKGIVAESRRLEREHPKILAVSFPGGYQWSDVEWMGPSAIVVTDNDPALARREAKRLSDMLYSKRDTYSFDPPDTAEGVRMAIAEKKSPVVLMDTGDNIGGGSMGDSTHFLVEFLRQKAEGWAMSLADVEAVKIAARAGVGGRFDAKVGAKRDKLHGEPVRITGVVRSLRTEPSANAVIEVDGSTPEHKNFLLLTSRASGGRNAGEYSDNGIDPKKQHILVSKGTVAPFATFQHVAGRIILVATPGPTDVNISRFTYKHLRRPLHGMK